MPRTKKATETVKPSKTTKTVRTAKKAETPKEDAKKVYVFFNCDENKSDSSKNVFFNHEVFQGTRVGRAALWKKVVSEMEAGRVHIAEENLPKAKDSVMEGNPTEAGQYMQYGAIDAFDIH